MNKKFVDSHSFSTNETKIKSPHHTSNLSFESKTIYKKIFWLKHIICLTQNQLHWKKNDWQLRRIYQNKNCFIEEKLFDIKLEKSNVSTKILFMILWFYSRVFCLLIQLFILTILSSWFLSFSLNYFFLFFLFFNWGFCHFRLNFTIFIFHIFQFW